MRDTTAGRSILPVVDKVVPQLESAQSGILRTIVVAARVETAIDNYDGPPTLAQRHELDWASEDGAAAVKALNRLIEHEMPAVYKALGDAEKWPAVKPVPTSR
jgi:hypothetical protein